MQDAYFKVNCGYGAVQQGCVAPINQLFALATAAGGRVDVGYHYGDDVLVVPFAEADVVEACLQDIKMPYTRFVLISEVSQFYVYENDSRKQLCGPYPHYATACVAGDKVANSYIGDEAGHLAVVAF